jgi:hypothetical protein
VLGEIVNQTDFICAKPRQRKAIIAINQMQEKNHNYQQRLQ